MSNRKRQKKRWMGQLTATWPVPGFLDYLSKQQFNIHSGLRYRNRIDFVGSNRLAAELQEYCQLRFLEQPESTETDPEYRGADLLLIEGCWPSKDDHWRDALLAANAEVSSALERLIDRYREAGVRVVLWLTDERSAYPALEHLFALVDEVYTAIPDRADGDSRFKVLPHGVHVKAFNPYRVDHKAQSGLTQKISYLIDGAFELMRYRSPEQSDGDLAPFWPYASWIVESSNKMRGVDRKFGPLSRRRFLGCIDEPGLAFMLRSATALFCPREVVTERTAYFQRRYLQAAATKTLVLSDADEPLQPMFGDGFFGMDEARLTEILKRLHQDKLYAAILQHLAWRHTVGNHTLFERIGKLLDDAGVPVDMEGNLQPVVNVVVPTIRPHQVPFVLSYFSRLDYPEKRLTVVLNGVRLPDDVAAAAADMENVKICSVPAYKSIGYCINYGVDQWDSDYWAKADDDDVYGPNYLSDFIIQRKYVDFDLAGKGAIFTYLEEKDAMHVRKLDRIDAPGDFVAGGALVVRNDGRFFPEDVRGYADTLFLLNRMEAEDLMVATDPFNFMQVRRADPMSHTWSAGSNQLNLTGPSRAGLDLSAVIV